MASTKSIEHAVTLLKKLVEGIPTYATPDDQKRKAAVNALATALDGIEDRLLVLEGKRPKSRR
jgi:hypothetical protein